MADAPPPEAAIVASWTHRRQTWRITQLMARTESRIGSFYKLHHNHRCVFLRSFVAKGRDDVTPSCRRIMPDANSFRRSGWSGRLAIGDKILTSGAARRNKTGAFKAYFTCETGEGLLIKPQGASRVPTCLTTARQAGEHA